MEQGVFRNIYVDTDIYVRATIIHNKIEAMNVQELKEVYKEGFGGTKGNGEIM